MKHSSFRVLTIVAVLTCVVGCQSSPRWAWWKKDEAPEDQSLLARSAPALPSAQSTPQPIESSALQPVAPPSSANLAATGPQPAAAGSMIPATSSATLASAPIASYPSNGSGANTAASSAGAPTTAAAPPQATVQSVPAAGPYDPNGYQPSAALASAPSPASGDFDRYSIGDSDAYADRYGADRYTAATTPPTTAPASGSLPADRYSASSTPTSSSIPEVNRNESAAVDRYAASSTMMSALPTGAAAPAPSPAPATPVAPPAHVSATSQLPTSAGQYRPGGTTSYTGTSLQAIEVATRPAPATTGVHDATPPEAGSVPWSPPASSPTPSYRAY